MLMHARPTEYASAYLYNTSNGANLPLPPSEPGCPTGRFQPTGYWRRRGPALPASSGRSIGMGERGVRGPNAPAWKSVNGRGRAAPIWRPAIQELYDPTKGE